MRLTRELENIRKLESVGFTHEQAETIVEIIEQSCLDSKQSPKEFINDKFDDRDSKFKEFHDDFEEIHNAFKKLELSMIALNKNLLIKASIIVAGCTSIALAIAKLLW